MEQKYKIEQFFLHVAMMTKDTSDMRVDLFHHLVLSNNIQLYNLYQASVLIS